MATSFISRDIFGFLFYPMYLWRIFREIVGVCIWNATSETFRPQLQFVTKNIDIWCTRKSEHWICHAFAKTIGKFIFVPPSRTADIFVATKWANPQYSEYEYMLVQYSYHYSFLIFGGQYFRSFLWRWDYYIENTVWTLIVVMVDTIYF